MIDYDVEAKILKLEAEIAALQAQFDAKQDDFPEIIDRSGDGGSETLGTKALYKVVALRAWRDGEIVAVGSESGSDSLEPTWDYVRMHE